MVGRLVSLGLVMVVGGMGCGGTVGDSSPEDPLVQSQTDVAAVPDPAAARELRAQGPRGLERALALYDAADRSEDPEGWERFVDAVGGARDTSVARLFWQTDMKRALAEAEARGVPVLSLRMLGDLREKLSCANSRFFRTTLYADPAVSGLLREEFVLHWSSERDVPVVEISFGDGRAIKTTTTGNSIHYLLDADGRILDAAPGLYSPGGFADVLARMQSLWAEVIAAGGDGQAAKLTYHSRAPEVSLGKVSRWLDEHGRPLGASSWASAAGQLTTAAPSAQLEPLALDAQLTTASKARVEVPVLRALGATATPQQTPDQALDDVFEHLSEAGVVSVELSGPTLALLRRDRPRKPGESESDYTARLSAMTQAFESSIARDELQNEYHLRIALHRWLADPDTDRSFEAFNERVYRELFMTPASDPWLGLVDDATYDGLLEAGITRLPG